MSCLKFILSHSTAAKQLNEYSHKRLRKRSSFDVFDVFLKERKKERKIRERERERQ